MKTSNLAKFFDAITKERARQDRKWGEEFDSKNTSNDWLAYIASYIGRALTLPWDPEQFKKGLVQVAALCAAAFEWCEHTRGEMPKRHYD